MTKVHSFWRIEANALTGSVLFEGDGLSVGAVADHARAHGLFDLAPGPSEPLPLMSRVLPPVRAVDRTLLDITNGTVDLPNGIFLALVATGLYQILRGQFRVPPWYTAFWYAFGLLTMFVVKKSVGDGSVESSRFEPAPRTRPHTVLTVPKHPPIIAAVYCSGRRSGAAPGAISSGSGVPVSMGAPGTSAAQRVAGFLTAAPSASRAGR